MSTCFVQLKKKSQDTNCETLISHIGKIIINQKGDQVRSESNINFMSAVFDSSSLKDLHQ